MSDVVEQHTIRPIPGSARHGSARDLLPFWFAAYGAQVAWSRVDIGGTEWSAEIRPFFAPLWQG
jgi:hypothetical protein